MLLTRGEAVQRNTSAEGVPVIRKQIQDLKDSWDSLLSASIQCKRLWSSTNQSFSQLMNGAGNCLVSLDGFQLVERLQAQLDLKACVRCMCVCLFPVCWRCYVDVTVSWRALCRNGPAIRRTWVSLCCGWTGLRRPLAAQTDSTLRWETRPLTWGRPRYHISLIMARLKNLFFPLRLNSISCFLLF